MSLADGPPSTPISSPSIHRFELVHPVEVFPIRPLPPQRTPDDVRSEEQPSSR